MIRCRHLFQFLSHCRQGDKNWNTEPISTGPPDRELDSVREPPRTVLFLEQPARERPYSSGLDTTALSRPHGLSHVWSPWAAVRQVVCSQLQAVGVHDRLLIVPSWGGLAGHTNM